MLSKAWKKIEWKAKLSTAHTGKNATMRNVHTGKKLSAKYLVNMNKARKGKNHSAEHRANIGKATKGKKRGQSEQ